MNVKFIVPVFGIILLICDGVSGWASFKHLSRQKRAWLETIAVKQGLHVQRHVAEMRALSRVKRSTCSSGGGGGGSRGGSGGIGRGGFGSTGRGGGGGGPVFAMETIVVTGTRLPDNRPSRFGTFLNRGRIGGRRLGGGGGGAPPAPPPEPKQTPAPTEKPKPTTAAPPKEPPEDKDAKKMTYEQFMYQLELLETQLKDVPPDQMAHKLRMLVDGYNSDLWKIMLNVNNPIPGVGKDVQGFQQTPGQQPTYDQIRQMMAHTMSGGAELGVIKVNGEAVALGHVITGATAGYDNQKVLGMDNLFATTISGDLGQSGLQNSKDPTSPIIGPSGKWKDGKYMLSGNTGEATRAEILGDIDGFNIGKRIMADKAISLSKHLKEYYNGESSRRFEIFKGHTDKATLQSEVYKFANLYDYKEAGLLSSVMQNTSPELAVRRALEIQRVSNAAVNGFCTAYATELGAWCK